MFIFVTQTWVVKNTLLGFETGEWVMDSIDNALVKLTRSLKSLIDFGFAVYTAEV